MLQKYCILRVSWVKKICRTFLQKQNVLVHVIVPGVLKQWMFYLPKEINGKRENKVKSFINDLNTV